MQNCAVIAIPGKEGREKKVMIRDLRDAIRDLMKDLNAIADELDKHYKNVNITKVSGGAAGVLGTGVAVVCLILAPFTAGITAIVGAAVGGGIATAGGVTSLGGYFAGKFLSQNLMKKTEQEWKKFEQFFKDYIKSDPDARQKMEDYSKSLSGDANIGKMSGSAPFTAAGAAASTSIRAVTSAGRVMAAFAAPFAVLSLVGVGFSIWDIVDGALQLHKDTKSPASETIRRLVKELKKVQDFLDEEIVR